MKILIIFFLFSSPIRAQDFVLENGKAVPTFLGQVKLFRGKVFKKNEKGTLLMKLGERFHKNDILITQEESFAKLMMIDETIISIGPKTEFMIDNYEFTDKANRKFGYTLLKGQITGNIKNKAAPGNIMFKTKFTSLGVRGTYVMMNARNEGQLDIAEFALLEGSAEITNEKKQVFPITRGERINFVNDNTRSVEEKVQISDEDMKRYKAEELDEEKAFKPFLDFLRPHILSKDSPLYSFFANAAAAPIAEGVEANKREEKKPHWKENLKKLNEKLRQ